MVREFLLSRHLELTKPIQRKHNIDYYTNISFSGNSMYPI